MLLEQRGHAVAGEDADAVIGNRSSYTELIGSQPRQLVLHARFLVERRQLYPEIGIGDHRGLKMFERLVDKPDRNSQRRSDEFRFVGGFVQRHGQQTALFVAQADSGIRKPVVVDGEPQIANLTPYAQFFVSDGGFWTFLAYCAVTGGSILIIGSATGVTVMGLEKIDFMYYTKRFSILALIGYCCGAGVYMLLFA